MRVLHIIDSLKSGGKERQLVELMKSLIDKDDVIIKLVILSDAIDFEYIKKLKLDIQIINRRHKKDLSIFFKLYNLCKEFKPDIIHSWELMCSIYSLPVAKLKGIKFINGIIRYSPSEYNISSRRWLSTKLTFIFSDIIVSNSHAGLKSYKSPEAKSYCIHNGFDFKRVNNVYDVNITKRKYNIKTNNIVGMVARFDKRKDYYSYIQSAINILKKRNDVTFITVGNGDTFNDCVKYVPEKYKEHIRFLGKQMDVESIVNAIDIGVLVSKEEGISNSIMEYMALRKPVVATNHGGNEEIVIHQKTGLLVRYNDINDLTEKIEYILENRDIAIAMGKAGKERLEKDFNTEKMAQEYISLYKHVLKQ
jgi:glycosyltransferase involved in cell wall biosynthesis